MEIPEPFRQTAPDQLEIREGGGCMSLFGLPFFAAGVFVTLIGARIVPLGNAEEVPFWGWPVMVLMGLVFIAVGGGLVFGRSWTTIDVSRGSIVKQRGLLVPMQHQDLRLYDYDAIAIRFVAGDSDTADRYSVILKARDTSEELALYSSTDYGESRDRAAFVAKFLHFPLEDATTTHTLVFGSDRIDETLQERMRSGNDQYENVAQPLTMRSQTYESNGTVQIIIPGAGFRLSTLLQFAIPIGVLYFIAPSMLTFFWQTHTPEAVQHVFIGFVLLVFGVMPLIAVINSVARAQRSRTLVTVNPTEIVIAERGAWRTRTTRIPADAILDLDYSTARSVLDSAQQLAQQRTSQTGYESPTPFSTNAPSPWWLTTLSRLATSKGITVKSRRGLVTFGAGLPDDEVHYLCSIIKRALGRTKDSD